MRDLDEPCSHFVSVAVLDNQLLGPHADAGTGGLDVERKRVVACREQPAGSGRGCPLVLVLFG